MVEEPPSGVESRWCRENCLRVGANADFEGENWGKKPIGEGNFNRGGGEMKD